MGMREKIIAGHYRIPFEPIHVCGCGVHTVWAENWGECLCPECGTCMSDAEKSALFNSYHPQWYAKQRDLDYQFRQDTMAACGLDEQDQIWDIVLDYWKVDPCGTSLLDMFNYVKRFAAQLGDSRARAKLKSFIETL